jgi:nitrate reductase delta subunit
MTLYKILSALLEYPEQELFDAVPDIRAALEQEQAITAREQATLEKFLSILESNRLLELQADYVQTFDLTPEYSLHLTHHLFGDDRGRGPALIDMSEYYRDYGLDAGEGELPDYLPMILEFAAQLEMEEAQFFLSQMVKVLDQLAHNLEQAGSQYAPLIRLIESRGRLSRAAA